jgi:type IV pilus assembly protein PilO
MMDIRDPGTQKMALIGTLILGILYGFFFTEILPFTYKARASRAAHAQAHLARLSADVTKARAAVAKLPEVEAEYEKVKERWESMASLLPNSKEIASLLTKVTVAGQESGVDFALFQPGPAREEDFYVTYPAQYRIEGGYHEVGRFMAEVANMDRIVNIVDLSLNASEADERHPERTVAAAFTAEAYAFRDTTGAKGAAAASAKSGANPVTEGQSKTEGKKP